MKRIFTVILFSSLFYGCDVIKQLPQMTGVTEAEAGEGIKEALGQGLVGAVLKLNKEDGFFKDAFYKILVLMMQKKLKIHLEISDWEVWLIKPFCK